MRIVRFGEDVAVPVSRFGSRFRIGPLTGADLTGRVQMMYLPPGGLIGRHPAAGQQLLAVVSGSGWASGADGVRHQLPAGHGAVWEPGEDHEVGSDSGLTAVCVEGRFDVWALVVTTDIVISDPDPAWAGWFEELHGHIWPAVADVAVRIDHVGSTSVPGLAAKPVIDMDIVVADEAGAGPVIERLEGLGYRWRGDLGIPGRESVHLDDRRGWPKHNLYVVVENNKAHLDHWLLRDLLRSDPDARQRYADLKRGNVVLAQGDMGIYEAAKAKLVAELLTRARAERGLPPATYWDPEADG